MDFCQIIICYDKALSDQYLVIKKIMMSIFPYTLITSTVNSRNHHCHIYENIFHFPICFENFKEIHKMLMYVIRSYVFIGKKSLTVFATVHWAFYLICPSKVIELINKIYLIEFGEFNWNQLSMIEGY